MATEKAVAAKSRNASLLEPAYALWISGMILVGKEAYDGPSQKARSTMSSVTAGMDYAFLPGVRAGMAVGISRDTTKIDDNGTSNSRSPVTGTLYASWHIFDTVFLDGVLIRCDRYFHLKINYIEVLRFALSGAPFSKSFRNIGDRPDGSASVLCQSVSESKSYNQVCFNGRVETHCVNIGAQASMVPDGLSKDLQQQFGGAIKDERPLRKVTAAIDMAG